jgi:hydrogenase maturation protease
MPAGNAIQAVPLVVGLGNPLGGDDSVGIEVIRLLRRHEELACHFLEVTQPGLDLIELCEREDWILFIDGVSSGVEPGTIHLIPLPSAAIEAKNMGALSSHGFGLEEIIELRLALQRSMPSCMLLGIEIESVKLGEPRSENVERAMLAVGSGFWSFLRELSAPASSLWRGTHRYSPEEFGCAARPEMGRCVNQAAPNA